MAMQLRLAEASAEVDAARTVHRDSIREMLDKAGAADDLVPRIH